MDIVEKMQSLVSSVTLSVVKNSIGLKNRVKWYANEIRDVERVTTQEQCLLGQVSVNKKILNQITPLLALNPCYSS